MKTLISSRPIIYLAYRKSTRSYYDGESSTSHEYVIDADSDGNALRDRINAWYARPEIISQERGKLLEVPAFAMESNEVWGSGGGCDYRAKLVIVAAPTLKV